MTIQRIAERVEHTRRDEPAVGMTQADRDREWLYCQLVSLRDVTAECVRTGFVEPYVVNLHRKLEELK